MRKYMILLLALALLFVGCSSSINDSNSEYFYYYQASALYDNTEKIIYAQPISTGIKEMSLKEITSKYLQGPTLENVDPPFTKDTVIVEITEEADNLTIVLSNDCSAMQQLELSLAGSCLAKTLFQFTQAQSITIQSEDGFSYIEKDLTFTRSNILTEDELVPTD